MTPEPRPEEVVICTTDGRTSCTTLTYAACSSRAAPVLPDPDDAGGVLELAAAGLELAVPGEEAPAWPPPPVQPASSRGAAAPAVSSKRIRAGDTIPIVPGRSPAASTGAGWLPGSRAAAKLPAAPGGHAVVPVARRRHLLGAQARQRPRVALLEERHELLLDLALQVPRVGAVRGAHQRAQLHGHRPQLRDLKRPRLAVPVG